MGVEVRAYCDDRESSLGRTTAFVLGRVSREGPVTCQANKMVGPNRPGSKSSNKLLAASNSYRVY